MIPEAWGNSAHRPGLRLQAVLPNLVKKLSTTDAELLSRPRAVPVGLAQGLRDYPTFGFRHNLT